MYTNSSCSLYLESKGYRKIYIPKCFLSETGVANYQRTGLTKIEKCFVMFDYDGIDLKFTEGKDYLFEGDVDITFDSSNPKSHSESLGRLLKTPGARVIAQADLKKYGSDSMWHYEISCK